MSAFETALAERVLLCDGAMGTLAQATGARADGPGAELTVIAPELVSALHQRYVDAGADVLETHTFGASRLRVQRHGLARRVGDLNLAAARLARGVADGAGRPVFVAGSVSPATAARGDGRADPADVHAAIREQAGALAAGGVDLVLLETFTHAEELVDAVAAVREATDLPVVAQATFVDEDGAPLTTHGESPAEVAARLADLGLAALGTNCTLGPQGLLVVVRRMAGAGVPLAAQPNAGLPHVVSDRSVRFAADAGHFGRYVARYVAAGARLVGGCCGTTPEHVAAATVALTELAALGVPEIDRAPEAPEAVVVHAIPRDEPGTPGTPGGRGVAQGRGAVTRGALARWLDAVPTPRRPRPLLVAAETSGPGGDDPEIQVARGLAAVGAGASLLWVGRERTRRPRITSAAVAVHLHDRLEVDTALTVTSWNASPMALQADLLGLDALGVRALVCETGNLPVPADRPGRDGVREVDAVGLVRLAAGLNAGVDADGSELATATAFRIGVRLTPGSDDLDRELQRVRAKVEAGAEFLLTRPVYELGRLRRVLGGLAALGITVPVLLSVAPLSGFTEAEHLRHEVPDVDVPDAVLARMRDVADDPAASRRVGLALAEELLAEVAGLVDGIVVRRPGDAAALATATTRLRAEAVRRRSAM